MKKTDQQLKLLGLAIKKEYSSDLKETALKLSPEDWTEFYKLLTEHAIVGLSSPVIKYIPDGCEQLKNKWKNDIYTQTFNCMNIVSVQSELLRELKKRDIPVCVIKGTSASYYYPHPQLRTMGDIDILTLPELFDSAYSCLTETGWRDVTKEAELIKGRHKCLKKNNVCLELHHHVSSEILKRNHRDAFFDSLIFSAITPESSRLPDAENGLVLLGHIAQHMESGIGLRQIIDWMMFCDRCLNDEMWYGSFRENAGGSGLELLAITVTRMCQKYLGLSCENITWCKNADEKVCDELLDYILNCGNFGKNRGILERRSVSSLPSLSHPPEFFAYLQQRGLKYWSECRKHPWLKPFAWAWQLSRYVRIAAVNKVGIAKLNAIYDEGAKRRELFTALGLLQSEGNG